MVTMKSQKKLRGIQRSADRHWVGNGFPVRSLFSYPTLGPVLSPFLLFDYVTALLLAGEPIDEPIVGQGPFVMNTPQEIRQAIVDYQSGRMGHLG